MPHHSTRFFRNGVAGVHRQLRRFRTFLSRSRARAGRVAPQPRRPQPDRRQRRPEHARSLHRSLLLQPAADARRFRPGRVLQIGSDSSGKRARPASGADRAAGHLQPGTSRAHPARRATRTRAARISRAPTSGPPRIRRTARARAGWAAIWPRCRRRSIRSSAWNTVSRHAARAAVADGVGRVDSERHRLRVQQPRTAAPKRRSSVAAAQAHRVARCRSISRSSRSWRRRRRPRWTTLNRVAIGRPVQAERRVSEQRASGRRCRRSRARWRRTSARRCSSCRRAASTPRSQDTNATTGDVREAHGDAQRRPDRVLQRPEERRPDQRHAASCRSPSSGVASPKTGARAPTTAQRA